MVAVRAAWAFLPLGAVLAVYGCKPQIEGRPSLVDGDRVLAVRSEPAEVNPSASVPVPLTYRALYVGTDRAPDPAGLDWALCGGRKPLAVTGPIAPACLAKSAKLLTPLGNGESVETTLPKDACRVFGPSPPEPKKGEPPSRPADPDTTGGYYQPARVLATIEGKPDYAVGVTRLDCGLAGATQEQSASYLGQHRPNENPALDSLVIRHDHSPEEEVPAADGSGAALQIKPGQALSLRASWAACPKSAACGDDICSPGEDKMSCAPDCDVPQPLGCTGSEPYLELDQQTHELLHRREAIRISWFATDGRFEHERTGRAETDAASVFSDNSWTAPKTHGEVSLWVVIRDDRGGVGWSAYKLQVQP
jgi:hypothetical protein